MKIDLKKNDILFGHVTNFLILIFFSIMWFSSWPLWSTNSPWYGSLSNEDTENFIPLSWHNLLIKIL